MFLVIQLGSGLVIVQLWFGEGFFFFIRPVIVSLT